MCVHGDIKDMCKKCNETKSGLKQSPLYYKVCSVTKGGIPSKNIYTIYPRDQEP